MAASSPNRPPPRSLEPWAPASCPPTRKALLELCSDRHPVPAPRATVRKPCPTPASPTPPHACLQNWGPYSASSLSHASVFPELGCASYSPPRHPELCSRETPFTQHEPLSSCQAGLLTSGPGNPRVSRAEAGRASVPALLRARPAPFLIGMLVGPTGGIKALCSEPSCSAGSWAPSSPRCWGVGS